MKMTGTVIRLRTMSETNEIPSVEDEKKDPKRSLLQVFGFLVSMEIFGICLQEVHMHGSEIRPLHRHFELPIILTIVDTISLLVILRVESVDGLMKHAEGLIVTFLSHISMEYLFNFWYIYSRNDSFAVGYFEPIVMIVLLKVCLKTEVSIKIVGVLVGVCVTAGFTSGEFGILLNANRNAIIIFLVIMLLSMRNIGLKLLHGEKVFLKLRKNVAIAYSFSILAVGVILSAFHLTYWALPVMFGIIAMFASVSTLYFTSKLLESLHVITIATLGVVSQICVNLVCIPVEHSHNIFISIFGTLLLVGVIAVFLRMFASNESQYVENEKTVPHHEVYTRLEFLIFMGLVCGIIFYTFKPKVSERDLNNLHSVGLDNFVKWLIKHN